MPQEVKTNEKLTINVHKIWTYQLPHTYTFTCPQANT